MPITVAPLAVRPLTSCLATLVLLVTMCACSHDAGSGSKSPGVRFPRISAACSADRHQPRHGPGVPGGGGQPVAQ